MLAARAAAKKFTRTQKKWCSLYEKETGFEPLMDDFIAGNESFVRAARKSARWFEDWSNDAILNITRHIPGEEC